MPGRKVDTKAASTLNLRKTGSLSDAEKQALIKHGHHVEHRPEEQVCRDVEGFGKQFNRTVKTTIHLPEEKLVKVPVVRKEREKVVEQHVVKGMRLVPVVKYKEVREVNLHDRAVAPGERARSGCSKTQVLKTSEPQGRTRKIPYTDFVEEEYEIIVDVPREKVKTRVGYRMDRQVHSNIVDVEEDCVFEMRPVLIKRGQAKASEGRGTERHGKKEYHGKAEHGEPVWGELHDGWHPQLGCISPSGSRPGTGASRPGSSAGSRPGTSYGQRPATPCFDATARPSSRSGSRMRSSSTPALVRR